MREDSSPLEIIWEHESHPVPSSSKTVDENTTLPETGDDEGLNTVNVEFVIESGEPKPTPEPGPSNTNENVDTSDWIKCSQCAFTAPVSSFPLRLNGTGHVRTCAKHTRPKRAIPKPSVTTLETVSWEILLDEVREQRSGEIAIDRFVKLDPTHPGACGETLLIRSNTIMESVKHAAGYRFNYKRRTDSTQKNEKSSVYTYYCAQLEGEQTKHALHSDESKRRPKTSPKILRFKCNGWCSITVSESNVTTARVRLTHAFAHVAVFSKRASGAGVGASTLEPEVDPTALVRVAAEIETVGEVTSGGALDQQLIAGALGDAVVTRPKRPRKRKRKDSEVADAANSADSLTVADGMLHPASGSNQHNTNTSDDAVRFPLNIDSAGDMRLHTGSDLEHASAMHLPLHAHSAWPPPASPLALSHLPPQHHHYHPFGPPHVPYSTQSSDNRYNAASSSRRSVTSSAASQTGSLGRVTFPSTYISALREKAALVFAAVEGESGMSIEEARAIEVGFFGPLIRLADEIEARKRTRGDEEKRG